MITVQNGCYDGHIEFSMNMNQNHFVHLEDHKYQIACNSNLFEKSPITTSWRPTWKIYENEGSVKSLGTPICTYMQCIKFRQGGIIFEEVKKLATSRAKDKNNHSFVKYTNIIKFIHFCFRTTPLFQLFWYK